MTLKNKLQYYLENDVSILLNKFKKKNIIFNFYNFFISKSSKNDKRFEKLDDLCKDYKFLTNYNKSIEINDTNQYTVLDVKIDTSKSLHKNAKNVLNNILKDKYVLVNNKPVNFKDCLILDVFDVTSINFSGFHTDAEYFTFTGYAFNVWYLIENCENYGNMFILESSDYKKKYTPCCINYKEYNIKDKQIPFKEVSYLYGLTNVVKNTGYLNKDNIKISYTNLKNGECIVMSKHLLHRGDHRRNNNVKGFHFRVLVKNEDGSIDYNGYYKPSDKFPNHRWDQKNKKLYGVELFDFV
jgi:hypothetical protein